MPLGSRKVWLLMLAAEAAGLQCGCGGPSSEDVFVGSAPSLESFANLGPVLEVHCGTLDCHGSSARNLRVYGIDGVRLDPMGITGNQSTTAEELTQTYASVISIQPEVLSRITLGGGARPERWLIVSKGRGTEHHKGGTRLRIGDDADVCVTSWLAGRVDVARCEIAAVLLPPGGEAF